MLPCAHAYCEQCIEAWLVDFSNSFFVSLLSMHAMLPKIFFRIFYQTLVVQESS